MGKENKDLSFINEIIKDLGQNGFVLGGKASDMLNDWKSELEKQYEDKPCSECGFILGSGGTTAVAGESVCKECQSFAKK